ncbi:MAG: FtsX-like permease family protein [Crocinitomicaceae bacterium]|nr:FtsX-like permease family protein [Crocinitomicaceae bacterium]
MSFEYFISKRILKNEVQGKKVSKAIVRISVISIALAIVVNLITIAIVKGFQSQVRDKVSGFGAHLSILSASDGNMYESTPILKNQAFFHDLEKNNEIKSISAVAYKPVLFQSDKNERVVKLSNLKDTIIKEQNVQGAILKGVENQYDWDFFKANLKEGSIPKFDKKQLSNEIIISKQIASLLNYGINDTIRAYFVRSAPILKKLVIKGIYETGLEDHDKKFAVGDLRLVQELNDWGIQSTIDIDDTLYKAPGYESQLIVRVKARGGKGQFRYDWGRGQEIYGAKTINTDRDTSFRVIVSDYSMNLLEKNSLSLEDTAIIKITISGNKNSINQFELEDNYLVKHYENETGTKYTIHSNDKQIHVEIENGSGSYMNYIAGFEIKVKDWKKLDEVRKAVKSKVEFIPSEAGEVFRVQSIKEAESDIFVWLDFLDINVFIIIVLMILIGIINMGSALLVLILVRTNFIGILKSLGASDWSIRKIFLYQASFLILRGMVIGNLIGLVIAFTQYYFNIIPLNPEVYYLDTVPIQLSFVDWLLLNVGTLIVCVIALIVPSVIITRINPSKAVRFN